MKKLLISLTLVFFSLICFVSTAHASSGITIDGKFDDWKSQPLNKWTTDDFTYHEVGFSTDDKNAYVYVSMAPGSPGGYKVMQPSGYKISVNGHDYDVTLHLNDKLWSLQPGQGGWFDADVWDRTQGKDTVINHAGYILRDKEADGRGNDVVEFAIPLSTFGKDVNQSSTLKFKNANLGRGEITTTGSSTAPYALAGVGAVMAAGGMWAYRRRKQVLSHEK